MEPQVLHITLYFFTGLLIKSTSTVYLQAAPKCEEMTHSFLFTVKILQCGM